MRIDVDQPDRAMPTGDGAQHRQRQRVVAAERQRHAAVRRDLVVSRLDALHAVRRGSCHDILIGHLQPFERAEPAPSVKGGSSPTLGGSGAGHSGCRCGWRYRYPAECRQRRHPDRAPDRLRAGASWWEYRQSAHVVTALGLVQHGVSLVLICDELKHLSNMRRLPRWPSRLPFRFCM